MVNKLTTRKLYELVYSVLRILVNQNLNTLPKVLNVYEIHSNNGFNKIHSKPISNGRGLQTIMTLINSKLPVMMIVRITILVFITIAALYVRWLVMGSTLPVFQETDNPASFLDNIYSRVSEIQLVNLFESCQLLTSKYSH